MKCALRVRTPCVGGYCLASSLLASSAESRFSNVSMMCCVQVLLSAKSLDQVHSATHAFFVNMCNLCYLTPPELAGRKHNMREATRQRLESLMDHALAAASAAAWLHAARQKLKELQVRNTTVHPAIACIVRGCRLCDTDKQLIMVAPPTLPSLAVGVLHVF